MKGSLIIVCAPSGTGKSTLIAHLMRHEDLNLHFSISATSRPPRGEERHGVEYYFVSEEDFRTRISRGDFLEYCEVYPGRFYGTLREEVDRRLERGENVILDLDVIGAENIKKLYGARALSLFIQPPSIAELRRRLEARATDAPEVIDSRIARAEFELGYAEKFDTTVVNDQLDAAKADILAKVRAFLRRQAGPRTAIFGGSFNPLHLGHLALARQTLDQGLADEVWFMVSPQNPLKDAPGLLDENLRLEMARKAVEGEEGISVSDFEFALPRPSYTWTTLQRLRETYDDRTFYLLIGADSAESFSRWYHAADILRTTPLIVYPREGSTAPESLLTDSCQGVSLLDAPLLSVSSTEIRRRCKAGEDVSALVPAAIAEDVKRLY